MIQRIQTIFFLLAGAAFGGMFFLPFATMNGVGISGIFSDGVYNVFDNPVLVGMAALGTLVALIAIFTFRKRQTQMRMGYLGIVLGILLPVVAFFYFSSQTEQLAVVDDVEDGTGIFLPVAAILLFALANYFTRKDEKLVRSMDRLR